MMVELPTYTSLFEVERRLYAVYDLELPTPVSFFEAGVFASAAAAMLVVARVLGVEITAATAWLVVVPPWFAAWLAARPVMDAKRPHEWAWSQCRYLLEPRTVHGLGPPREPDEVTVVAVVRR